ncbi:MAG: hypothetical protein LJE67_13705 [Salaquimonas sp.]|jgi:hypothetical protein|nr:hypothetical protein [Salaquimonas sp.]
MLRAIMAGLWAVILVAGSAYYFSVMAGTGKDGGEESQIHYDLFNLNTMSVPIIRNNEIRGYILIEAVFAINPDVSAKLPFPVEYQIRDAVYEALFSDRELDIFQLDKLDTRLEKEKIRKTANAKYPDLVGDIKLQYFDFMSKDEVRDMKMRRF